MSEMLPCTCRHGDEPYCPRHTPLPGERSAVTAPALDVLRDFRRDAVLPGVLAGESFRRQEAFTAALADLDALVQAAEAWRADLYQDGPACRRFGVALARVTGEART